MWVLYAILGEAMKWQTIVGGVLITLGTFVMIL
jgi:drug/metabolite transporter (DMT)-like permease